MKTHKLLSFFIPLLIIILSSCNADGITSDTSSKKTLLNVSYGSHPQQVFDLYLPANRSTVTTKTLILIHGGGWNSGDKDDMKYVINIINQNLPDYAIANINYRLAFKGNPGFPMQLNDIKAVINKLKDTRYYNISDDFGLIGMSAGGHLSLLYSYAHNSDKNIKMVCSIVGPTDFTDTNYLRIPDMIAAIETATGVSYMANPAYYDELSPLSRATLDSPPTILFYGNQDPIIPTTQAINMHERLDRLGVYNEFNLYNGGHANWVHSDQLDVSEKLATFIKISFSQSPPISQNTKANY